MHKLKRIYWRLFRGIFVSSDSEFIFENQFFQKNEIYLTGGAQLIVRGNCCLDHCQITLRNKARLIIERGTLMQNMHIVVDNAQCIIGDECRFSDAQIEIAPGGKLLFGKKCVIEKGENWQMPIWMLKGGSKVEVADHNRIRCNLYSNFKSSCIIGKYNCLNEQTEIRVDENVSIGEYNMISYNCRIWDTDTHAFYADDLRRRMTREMYPNIGVEKDKPKTKPVSIGSDNLLGEYAAVLKGSVIGNRCKIGFRAIVSNEHVPDGSTCVGNYSI